MPAGGQLLLILSRENGGKQKQLPPKEGTPLRRFTPKSTSIIRDLLSTYQKAVTRRTVCAGEGFAPGREGAVALLSLFPLKKQKSEREYSGPSSKPAQRVPTSDNEARARARARRGEGFVPKW